MYVLHTIENYLKNSSICVGKLIILPNAVCHVSPKIALSSLKNTDRFLLPNKLTNSEKRILSGIPNACLSSPIHPKQQHCLQMWYLLEFASYKVKCLAELNPYSFHSFYCFTKNISLWHYVSMFVYQSP